MKKELILFLSFIIVGSILVFWASRYEGASKKLLNKKAPLFVTESLEGQKLDLKEIIGKKVVFINFWATFCPPCRKEMPLLNQMYKSLSQDKFMMVSIIEDMPSNGSSLQELVKGFRQKIPFDFPVYKDTDSSIAGEYGTFQIPESFLIDLNGKVIEVIKGEITEFEMKQLVKKIQEISQ